MGYSTTKLGQQIGQQNFTIIILIITAIFSMNINAQYGEYYCVPEGATINLLPVNDTQFNLCTTGDWNVVLEDFCVFKLNS